MTEHERIWLEPAGAPDRCWCQDNQWGEEGVEYVLASALESLRRENEELRNGPPITGKWKDDERAKVWEYAFNKQHTRAEAAEAEVKRLRESLEAVLAAHDIKSVKGELLENVIASATDRARTALASTGGEHNAE